MSPLVRGADAIAFGPDGLVPAIVQDAGDGAVLMLAWMDAEAIEATLATGEVHFHSRSRGRLWRKGETSGHVLRLRSITADCDADALLVSVDPVGPTCHRGTRTCFDAPATPGPRPEIAKAPATGSTTDQGFAWLERLWSTIVDRAATRPSGSYTVRLLDGGVDMVARKVTEEATEVLLAARDDAEAERIEADRAGCRAALAGESADLLYHLLVLLAERDVAPAEVLGSLQARHGDPA